jgi:Uma2 family endonuclease
MPSNRFHPLRIDDFVEHAPELVAEVAASGVSIELHKKLHVYRRSGVREYIVYRVLDRKVDWFVLRDGEFMRLDPDEKGHYRSETFPGLWLDATALVEGDIAKVLEVLRQGLATPAHAKFVSHPAARSSSAAMTGR